MSCIFMRPPGWTGRWRHNVQPVRSFVRLLPKLWTWYSGNEWTNFDASWHKWSTGQGHEAINCKGQGVKG